MAAQSPSPPQSRTGLVAPATEPRPPALASEEHVFDPSPASSSAHALNRSSVKLSVVNSNGAAIHFRIKSSTPLRKLMDAYCQREGVPFGACRFIFDGVRIAPEHTPEQLKMEDEDRIDVMIEQTGGHV